MKTKKKKSAGKKAIHGLLDQLSRLLGELSRPFNATPALCPRPVVQRAPRRGQR